MRLNGNYCGKDESEELYATSLEAIIMRAKFACHMPDERGLMLHVILIKNAAVRWGHALNHMQLSKRGGGQSCTSSSFASISAQVANLYMLETLHTAVCRDKSRGLRRSGRRKARGSRRRRSCCWWSRWGRGQRALRSPSRSNLAEGEHYEQSKETFRKMPAKRMKCAKYVSSAGGDDDDDDDGNDGDDNEEEGDEQSGTQLPVDKGDNRNDRVDNDRRDCDNLVGDNHEMMTTGMLSTKKWRTMMCERVIHYVACACGSRWLTAGISGHAYMYTVKTGQIMWSVIVWKWDAIMAWLLETHCCHSNNTVCRNEPVSTSPDFSSFRRKQ